VYPQYVGSERTGWIGVRMLGVPSAHVSTFDHGTPWLNSVCYIGTLRFGLETVRTSGSTATQGLVNFEEDTAHPYCLLPHSRKVQQRMRRKYALTIIYIYIMICALYLRASVNLHYPTSPLDRGPHNNRSRLTGEKKSSRLRTIPFP
jgi:hypothetical protein